jgi:hypothetical protein
MNGKEEGRLKGQPLSWKTFVVQMTSHFAQ